MIERWTSSPTIRSVMSDKASIYQGEGNLQEAAKILSGINETSSRVAFGTKILSCNLNEIIGELIRLLQARLAEVHFDLEIDKAAVQVALACTQRLAGDTAGAKVTAEQARDTLERLYRDQTRRRSNLLTTFV